MLRSPEAAPREIANNVSLLAPDQRERAQARRADRYLKRSILWSLSSLQRVRYCGRHPSATAAEIGVRLTAGVAGFAGLQTCGSVWADPVCSAKVLSRRAVEIGAALSTAVALGYELGFFTFTMRHRRTQPLDLLWSGAQRAWKRAISGKGWSTAVDRCGVVGWVRVWEVTDGRNGWHPHLHGVVVLRAGSTAADLDEVCRGMFRRWRAGLIAAGLETPRMAGQEWHLVAGADAGASIGDYLAKLGRSGPASPEALGLELTHVQPGRARAELRTQPVWSILDDVMEGEAVAVRRWHEWERVSKGKRQVGWSKDLRSLLAVPDERSDEDLAAEEIGTERDTLVMIDRAGWQAMIGKPWRLPLVLDAAESGGLAALRSLLDSWGDVPYFVPSESN